MKVLLAVFILTLKVGPDGQVATTVRDRFLPTGEPILRMPFPAGTVVLCQQANNSPKGLSHTYPNTQFAIDFSNVTAAALDIVAAADGVATFIYSNAKPGHALAGRGFGNYVKLDHGNGFFTLYAHLDEVTVKKGQQVSSGAKIGTMGDTGNAGYPHLHFSLHRANAQLSSVPVSIPIHALMTADLTARTHFQLVSGLELIDAHAASSLDGHLYGSENQLGKAATLGKPQEQLAKQLSESYTRLTIALAKLDQYIANRDLTSAQFANELASLRNSNGDKWVLGRLSSLLALEPKNLVGWYWLGRIASDSNQVMLAREAFSKIAVEAAKDSPPWLLPWTYYQLGLVEERAGNVVDARLAYKEALDFEDNGQGFKDAAKEAISRLDEN